MKRWIALFLVLLLCLPLSGCGKSEAYRAVEAQIASLDTITLDSEDALLSIAEAIEALTEEEQEKIKGQKSYNLALSSYYKLFLPGVWYPFHLYLGNAAHIYEPEYSITFHEDYTLTYIEESYGGSRNGSWVIKDGKLILSGVERLATELSLDLPDKKGEFILELTMQDGLTWLNNEGYAGYLKEDDYFTEAANVVKVVDLEKDDLSEVFDFAVFEHRTTDEWGAHTGKCYQTVGLTSRLYEQGWRYFFTDEPIAIEVSYPSYHEYFVFEDGGRYTDIIEAGSYTITDRPFQYLYRPLNLGWEFANDQIVTTDLEITDLKFTRGKGKLYFINERYIKDVVVDENGVRELMVYNPDGDNQFLGADARVWVGDFEEGNENY